MAQERPKVLLTRKVPVDGLTKLKASVDLEIWEEERPIPREELLSRVRDKDGLICLLSERIDTEVMERAPKLRVIGNYAVGFDNIDIPEATKRGIPVINTPGVLTEATADLAFALLLAAARRIGEGERMVRGGLFRFWSPTTLVGKGVWGAKLGVVGAGKIGEAMLRRGKGFGMELIYTDSARKKVLEEELGARFSTLEGLLSESDFVSLHVPLMDSTRHLIGERELRLMGRDAFLINTSRGPVVDEKALWKALSENWIRGAGLDVYEEEPKVHPPLLELENVVMVPHIGSATTEARRRMAELAANGVLEVLSGGRPQNTVNPEVYPKGKGKR